MDTCGLANSIGMHPAQSAIVEMRTPDGIAITCYENELPPFVEEELERLYASVFSSMALYSVYGGAEHASTYVARDGGKIISLLLFRHRDAHSVEVINEWIRLDHGEVLRFVEYIFAAYQSVNVISFHAVDADIRRLAFPCQRFNCTDDSVIMLPSTPHEYLERLGKATRRNIRRYLHRIQEDFPSFRYQVFEKENVNEQHVRDIIRLNRVRMANKNKVSGIDAEEEERILQLAKRKGLVGVATIDGKVCAGAIAYRIGDRYYSFVRAHEPAYDSYRFGVVGAYLLVSECIARGGKDLHLMWGREEHKSILLGVHQAYDHVCIYRSRPHVLLCLRTALKTAYDGYTHRARLWVLHKAKHGDDPVSRLAGKCLGLLRGIRSRTRAFLQKREPAA